MQLTAIGCQSRRQRLISKISADYILINSSRHIQYFTGMYISQLALSSWGPNYLWIDCATGESTLLSHNFLADQARNAHVDNAVIWTWYDAVNNVGVPLFATGLEELINYLPALSGKTLAIEKGHAPLGLPVDKTIDITNTILQMRRVKDPDELAIIREVISIVEAGHASIRQEIRPGLTELDVQALINHAMMKRAGMAIHLMGDYLSGERIGQGGGPATPRVLQSGDMMLLDLYAIIHGYRGDFATTISVDGYLEERFAKLETVLHASLKAGESMLKSGTSAHDITQAVYQVMREAGLGDHIVHHVGHGLGLGHPEAPYFVPNSDEVLMAGEVVTLEPGLFGDGYGARIEHNYLVTTTGFERLSNHNTSFK